MFKRQKESLYFPLRCFICRCKCCVLHWRGESLSSWNKVFISGKSGLCAVTYPLSRFKYCTCWISDLGCFSWQNSVCDERNSVCCESWFYQWHWSLRLHSWLAGGIPPALTLWETRSWAIEEDLSHLCLSWDGGLMALNDLVFYSSIQCCFSSHEKRECGELSRMWKDNLFSPCKF